MKAMMLLLMFTLSVQAQEPDPMRDVDTLTQYPRVGWELTWVRQQTMTDYEFLFGSYRSCVRHALDELDRVIESQPVREVGAIGPLGFVCEYINTQTK